MKFQRDVTVNLLVISTVCSFVLGGLVSGLLLSLYCRRALSKAKRSSKMADTCCPSPTISLPTLVKLNRLLELDGDAKEGKEDGCSPRMYTSFLVNGEPKNPQDQCPQLVGLPTPDATPELPVRRSTGLRNLNHNDAKDFGEVKACRLTGPIRRSPSGQNVHIPSAAVLPNNTHDRPVPALAPAHGARERDAITVRDEHKLPTALPIKEVALDTLMRQIQEMGGSTEAKLIDTAIVCPAVPLANRNQPRVPDTETAAYYTSCTLPRDSLVGTCPPGGQCRSAVEANGRSLLSRNPLPPSPGVTDHTASRPAPCEPGSLPPPGLARTDSQAGTGRRVRRAASIKPELLPKPLLPQSPGKPLS
uniref:Uncharacterized protein n=1 Tax=Callorhinchus milii TaxID=7868 RepID=A0A4W3GQI7_CALMI